MSLKRKKNVIKFKKIYLVAWMEMEMEMEMEMKMKKVALDKITQIFKKDL